MKVASYNSLSPRNNNIYKLSFKVDNKYRNATFPCLRFQGMYYWLCLNKLTEKLA